MSDYNRPYLYEIAANAVAPDNATTVNDVRALAQRHGIPAEDADRAIDVLTALTTTGEDIEEWVRRQYLLDGWIEGYLAIDPAALSDPHTYSTWGLAQYAYAHYGR
ncbi:hypothetical protein FIV07_28130 (plasmid) [Mycobacterium sp. THAF192]|nr:hypothetical protein FIV07_28130 [Mycobacterium sp. THAF192]